MAIRPSQIRATTKYEGKVYDKITVRIRKDRLDVSGLSRSMIQEAADKAGQTVNAYILQAVSERMENES